MVALTELWWQNCLWLWTRSCSSKNAYQFVKSLTSTCSAGNLNRGPRACRCQSSCHLKRCSLSICTTVHVSVTDGSSDCCCCSCSPTSNLRRYSIFASTWDLSSLGVWQVSAAQDEASRFNPANVFSSLNRRSEYDNKYKSIHSAARVSEWDRTTKWNHVFWGGGGDQVTTATAV